MKTTFHAFVLACVIPTIANRQSSTIRWFAFDMGFSVSSAGNGTTKSAVGQMLVGRLQQASTRIESGFLVDSLLLGPTPVAHVSGTVRVGGNGLATVTVKLLDDTNAQLYVVVTDAEGNYDFGFLAVGNYSIMIVEPLGYLSEENPKQIVVADATPLVVDFALTEVVVGNNARKLSYWKHQFDAHVTGRGRFEETAAQLQNYIDGVHQYYTPHFDIFADHLTFGDWQEALSRDRDIPPYVDKAMQQIAALVMNFASLRVGQYTVVTEDGRTAGDVLTYVSQLFTDPGSGTPEIDKAKTLAKRVNDDTRIGAGEVPSGSILYKGTGRSIN